MASNNVLRCLQWAYLFGSHRLYPSVIINFVLFCQGESVKITIGELEQSRFWVMHVKRKWIFFFMGSSFAQIFGHIVSLRIKTLSNTNLVASSHTINEKASLLVDVRRSKTPFLKLPINHSKRDVFVSVCNKTLTQHPIRWVQQNQQSYISVACSRLSDSRGRERKRHANSWRGGKKEKGREREPVIIYFKTLFGPLLAHLR